MSDKLREALKRARNYIQEDLDSDLPFNTIEGPEAIEAIDAALAQPQNDAEAVPAMWQFRYRSINGVWTAWLEGRPLHSDVLEIECRPLYTAPPSPERMREALEAAKVKLQLYRKDHCGIYIGGVEYNALMKMIDEALRAGDNHARDGKESEGGILATIDPNYAESFERAIPSDPTPPDREAIAERLQKRLGNRTVSVGPGIYEDIRDAVLALRREPEGER